MTQSHPAARTVDSHPKVRNVAKYQIDQGERKPKPPCPLPEVVVDQRNEGADHKPNPEPNRLPLDEKINVSMAIKGKRTRAEKHDDADDE